MIYLLLYFLGIVTATLVFPVISIVSQIFEGWANKIISKLNLDVLNYQKKAEEIQESLEKQNTNAIGFAANYSCEDLDE